VAKKFTFPIIVIFILILAILTISLGYFFYTKYYLASQYKLPPPLANVEFPSNPKNYPSDWPADLRFPNDFVLVDSSSGKLPEGMATGWALKLRYEGKPADATNAITSFLKDQRWTIVERNKLDSGGFSLLIQREQGNGIVVIDVDPKNALHSLIIATIFPQ
jgi:hypothetical protein